MTDLPLRLALVGAANVRDLGGRPTTDGRLVRTGVLYRSDSLHRITAGDLDLLRGLGLRTILDLRSAGEVARSGPLVSDALGVGYVHLEIRHGLDVDALPTPDNLRGLDLPAVYRRYLEVNGGQLATALRLLSRPEASPVLFHCFAGKDRTGVLAVLVLSLLGVADEAVAADYADTATSFARFLELVAGDDPPILETDRLRALDPSFLEARAETALELLAWIRERDGSVEDLVAGWGIGPGEVAALRDHLLRPAP